MKDTGIVRTVDDLGRVAIPKEIRLTLGIKEWEDVKIYVDNESVVLRRRVVSNGDRIRQMTDEELADFIFNAACPPGKNTLASERCCTGTKCWLEWLREEPR